MIRPRILTPSHLENLREDVLLLRKKRHLELTGNLEEDLKGTPQKWSIQGSHLINEDGVMIDQCDSFWILDRKARVDVYAQISVNRHLYRLHNLICPNYDGGFTDHINQNKLDNRRCNLRAVSIRDSNINRPFLRPKKSRFRGVCPAVNVIKGKRYEYWRAFAFVDGKQHAFGSRKTELEAARLYNEKIKSVHGEFAILNDLGEFERKQESAVSVA